MPTVVRKLGEGPRSREFAAQSTRILSASAAETLHLAEPVVVKDAKGSRFIDLDGREYIDLTMGFGPLLLGHAHDIVKAAVCEAVERGWHYAIPHYAQRPLADLMGELVPCADRVLFCNTGTEATMFAIRAARAYSGRTKIAVFEGSYHGAHDYVLTAVDQDSPIDAPTFSARKGGVTAEALSTVMMLPYWNDAAYDLIITNASDLAAVIIEPVQGGNPQSGQGDWLRGLERVCREAGVLLILDEIITGFRLGLGGGQGWFDLRPDLATYGKVLGGGLPIGAVAGRADVMESFVAHESDGYPKSREAFRTGTFNGNPLSTSAGLATIRYLADNPQLYDFVNENSDRLASEVNGFASSEGIPAHINNCGSVLLLHFGTQVHKTSRGLVEAEAEIGPSGQPLAVASAVFFELLLRRGVVIPGVHHFHLSTAHTPDDVDYVIAAMQESMTDVRRMGLA